MTPLVDYLDCTSCLTPDPLSTTSVNIVYTVSVEDWAHCNITQNTYRIIIELKTSLDVPTAFTPNGDGINDVIFAGGWGSKKFVYFKIFNR